MVKTVRTISVVEEKEMTHEQIKSKPKYKVGEMLEIYSGSQEGCTFKVLDIRYNFDSRWCEPSYEYLMGDFLGCSWRKEGCLTR